MVENQGGTGCVGTDLEPFRLRVEKKGPILFDLIEIHLLIDLIETKLRIQAWLLTSEISDPFTSQGT